jgi:hypothetical protein
MDSQWRASWDDRRRAERLRSVARTVLTASLALFFISVVLLGLGIGDQRSLEEIPAYTSLAIALTGIAYIALGLKAAARGRNPR